MAAGPAPPAAALYAIAPGLQRRAPGSADPPGPPTLRVRIGEARGPGLTGRAARLVWASLEPEATPIETDPPAPSRAWSPVRARRPHAAAGSA